MPVSNNDGSVFCKNFFTEQPDLSEDTETLRKGDEVVVTFFFFTSGYLRSLSFSS